MKHLLTRARRTAGSGNFSKEPKDREVLLERHRDSPPPPNDFVDHAEYLEILAAALSRRNGWKTILENMLTEAVSVPPITATDARVALHGKDGPCNPRAASNSPAKTTPASPRAPSPDAEDFHRAEPVILLHISGCTTADGQTGIEPHAILFLTTSAGVCSNGGHVNR